MSIRKSKWAYDGVPHWSVADGHETIGVVDVIDGEYVATDVDGMTSIRRGVGMPVSVARKIEFLVRSGGEYLDVQVRPSSSPGSKPALPAWQRQRLRRKRMRQSTRRSTRTRHHRFQRQGAGGPSLSTDN